MFVNGVPRKRMNKSSNDNQYAYIECDWFEDMIPDFVMENEKIIEFEDVEYNKLGTLLSLLIDKVSKNRKLNSNELELMSSNGYI